MPSKSNSQPPYRNQTPGPPSGSLVFDLDLILLPPIAVLIVGLMLAFVLGEISASAPREISAGTPQIAPLFTSEVQYWAPQIVSWSADWGLDPNLVATVMQIESCGHPRARSSAGAMGLFQVMPFHFETNEDPYWPNTNAYRGLAYLRSALDARGGDPRLAFAGYNGGITGAQQPEYAWPAETVRYVYWGIGIYTDARAGLAHSQRLDEWLAAGGASLCASAAWVLGTQ